ncbi:MAG TPA: putative peptidoglycan glycosyltransferase FtsW [Candidatus Paceibacterota bacterium]|nr:cell division protein FtsW [Verrucomicrobiota bacterium]HOX01183.1 putative peptidoglycan glycosyltransferase FtsW [Verrucomicrobiota bacterium]HRZ45765.1 putative peptidoglycan glycosyltransferase FtsW [Candidatus Paceibacterota bacterium]
MKTSIWLLIVSAGALLALGLVMLYSAEMAQAGQPLFRQQLMWCGIGLAAAAAAAAIVDYRWLKHPVICGAGFLLAALALALVLWSPLGVSKLGATRWLRVGFAMFQPSELAKVVAIVCLAAYAEYNRRRMRNWRWGLLYPGLGVSILLLLIFREPDWGATLHLAAAAAGLLYFAGARVSYILVPSLIGLVVLAFLLQKDPVRRERVEAWLDPEAHQQTAGHQQWRGILAFGSGGAYGLGLGHSRQKLGFLPEHQTDFLYPIVGEELGLIGSLAVLGLQLTLIASGFLISRRASDWFGFYLGSGLTLLIGIQALLNMAVVTAVLPNKGIPLPLLSYGGSNLVMVLASLGLLLSIARRGTSQPLPIPETTRVLVDQEEHLPNPQPA